MVQSNVQVIQDFYADLGRGELSAAFTHLDPEFELHQAESLPYGGVYRGYESVTKFFEVFGRTWANFQSTDVEYLEAGDYVIVRSRIRGQAKQSGNELEMPMIQVFQMRDGKAITAHPFYWDTARLLQVL
ncbi:MAG: nuclear transport factor 2 family protein [Roseiflexaceae bacterium]|nr:nuclear transport factor 2 family protein [Roseiflexaceae bacterium]